MYEIEELKKIAMQVRKDIIEETYLAASGHPGGSLSCVEILVSLYFQVMNIDPKNPRYEDRDRLILSKGHACPSLYSVLAHRGYFDVDILKTFRKIGSILQGHPDLNKVPGIDMTNGSLGQGLSIANGMALAGKLNKKDYYTYAILGDGEIEEGQIWEAAMTAAHYKLNKLIVFVDYNNLQIDGKLSEVKTPEPIKDKFEAFGFKTVEIDGHDFNQIINAISEAKKESEKPTAIIAHTIKGKGISFMEDQAKWHGKAPNEEEYNKAIKELSEGVL